MLPTLQTPPTPEEQRQMMLHALLLAHGYLVTIKAPTALKIQIEAALMMNGVGIERLIAGTISEMQDVPTFNQERPHDRNRNTPPRMP